MQVAAPVFGHAGRRGVEGVGDEQLGAFIHKHACHLHLGLQFGQREARVLESGHGLAKHRALLHVVHRPVNGGLRRGDGPYSNLQALPRQLFHQADKAPVFLRRAAQQVLARNTHIVKKELSRILRLEAQLFEALAHREARHAPLHQQQAGALGTCGRVGLGHHNHQIGMPAIGDEGLAAVEQVAAVGLRNSSGLDAL